MLEELQSKWSEILNTMRNEYDISDMSFGTWIKDLKVHSIKDNTIYIIISEQDTGKEDLAISIIKKKYADALRVTISEFTSHDYDLEFITKRQVDARENKASDPAAPVSNPNLDSIIYASGLNPKYTFESFVVGENNSFAHSAALAVAEAPGEIYNPLFIYGGVGLGKTHLMQAIANFILQRNPNYKVKYVPSETFTNELIESIRNDKSISRIDFREKYRNLDVLLIDDIQFIIGKQSTQDEFFHTFNTLKEAKKQIIISSDRAPKYFDNIEERLSSRFEQGIMADITPPDYETRMAILRNKTRMEGYTVDIDEDVLDYIAANVKSNIRELEGSLNKLIAGSRFKKSEITLDFARDTLKDIIDPDAKRDITPDLIIDVVADYFNISSDDITGPKRTSDLVYPRHICMYLCKKLTDLPYKSIGVHLGKRDHSTVLHGCEKIENSIKTDSKVSSLVDSLIKKINPS